MSDNKNNISELRKEILLGFHTQFAENQRTREQSFLKILSFLGAVIFGYAYVFHNYPQISSIEFSYVALLSELLLSFGALIIVTISYNFRRDQVVNAKIRTLVRLIGDDKIFPTNYDPRLSNPEKRIHNWMPDFLNVFYFLFPIVQLVLYISFLDRIDAYFSLSTPELGLTLVSILCVFSIFLTPLFNWIYFRKINRVINENR